MRNIITYESYYRKTLETDIRTFFSNLKMLSYFFEDYYKFNDFLDEIQNDTGVWHDMSFFGFTNEFQYIPLVDTVTKHIHRIFHLIIESDYQKIYDYCNSERSDYNYFEKKYNYNFSNHMSEELSKLLYYDDLKPYFSTRYNTKLGVIKVSNDIENIIKKSDLNDKYNMNYYSKEIRIIAKNRITFNAKQLEEIEKAKEFGLVKYEYLQFCIKNKSLIVTGDKYNL